MASRSLEALCPIVQVKAALWLRLCADQGLDILVYCTYRDEAEQNALYAQGRTTPGNIVTNARGGESFHNWKCALDFVPLLNGRPQWNDKKSYLQAAQIAESLGFEWAGRWNGKLRETAHLQYTGGLRLNDLMQGKEIK